MRKEVIFTLENIRRSFYFLFSNIFLLFFLLIFDIFNFLRLYSVLEAKRIRW